ncbi:DinB family protein [uncultured Aquimarina sp.]|uniref:DinB family protein n=1 Tax=uncultured Aquimarina sp. TaxID=575652 RepID=UPI0026102B69|nr:DinB family protein [uncultured Aquimarina sp.]
MNRSKQIANRFREVMLDGIWIANTNYKDQLSSVDWKQANSKIESLNTIAVLAFHINYYIEGVLNVLKGGPLEIKDTYSFDAPAITSEDDWKALLNTLWNNSESFANLLDNMSDEQWDEVFVDKKYGTYQRNIDAMIEHSYYHLGQITLIKKMISNE